MEGCNQGMDTFVERTTLTPNWIWEQNFAIEDEPYDHGMHILSNIFSHLVNAILAAQLPSWHGNTHHLEVRVRRIHLGYATVKGSVCPLNPVHYFA